VVRHARQALAERLRYRQHRRPCPADAAGPRCWPPDHPARGVRLAGPEDAHDGAPQTDGNGVGAALCRPAGRRALLLLRGKRSAISATNCSGAPPMRGSVPLTFGSTFCRSCSSTAACYSTPGRWRLGRSRDVGEHAVAKGGDVAYRIPDGEDHRLYTRPAVCRTSWGRSTGSPRGRSATASSSAPGGLECCERPPHGCASRRMRTSCAAAFGLGRPVDNTMEGNDDRGVYQHEKYYKS
jgi:hypothetical protein